MTTRGTPVRRLLVALLVLPAAALAACSSGAPAGGEEIAPGAAPSAWDQHAVGPVTLHAPPEWEPFATAPSGDGDEAFALRSTADGPGTGVHVTVTPERSRDVDGAVDNLVTVGDATLGAQDVVTEQLAWTGAQAAGFVAYTATLTTDDGDVEMRYEYLVLDLDDEAQAVVAVIAPLEGFDDSGAHGVLQSVTVS